MSWLQGLLAAHVLVFFVTFISAFTWMHLGSASQWQTWDRTTLGLSAYYKLVTVRSFAENTEIHI